MLLAKFAKRTLLSLLPLLILLLLTSCAPRSNRFGIIFTNGNADLYQIPDNTQTRIEQLTFTPTVGEYQLLVSKNSDKVVFKIPGPGAADTPSDLAIEKPGHIYLLDTASKKLKDMTDIFALTPTTSPVRVVDWSPDQKQFAVVTYKEGHLQFVDADGTNRRDIPIPSLGEISPYIDEVKWSPDGKKLAVTQSDLAPAQQLNPDLGGTTLLVYDLESGKSTQIASNLENCGLPVWSPNSQQIAANCSFHTQELGRPTVLRVFDIENPAQSYEHLAFYPCLDPSWSPDGKQIAFICKKNQFDPSHLVNCVPNCGPMGIFIMNSEGNGIHEVKPENLESWASLATPTWSPDGKQIIYIALTINGRSRIYSVYPDGSNNQPLTDQAAFYNIVSVYPVP